MIATAYYYKMPKGEAPDPFYMMSIDIPGFTDSKYGLLSGVVFTIFFSFTVLLFSGLLSDNCSRRLLLGAAGILWSVTSLTTAIS